MTRASGRGVSGAGGGVRRNACGLGVGPALVGVPAHVWEQVRPLAPMMAERVTERIQHEVQAYAGPGEGRRHGLIQDAVTAAILDFAELARGRAHHHAEVDRRFREMGSGLAIEGHDLGPVLVAFQVAGSDLWREIGTLSRHLGLTGDAVLAVGEQVANYLRHLAGQLEIGFRSARVAVRRPTIGLVRALLSRPMTAGELGVLASAAEWVVPGSVVVMVTEVELSEALGSRLAECGVLAAREGTCTVLIGGEETRDAAIRLVLGSQPHKPVAVTWPVEITEVRHAHRWAQRALRLRQDGRIDGSQRVVDCAAFKFEIWWAADESLVSSLAAQVLAPLRAARPTQRPVLAATLEGWLATRGSTKQLAAHFNVHEQTVRNHIRRLRELFGDRLDDPDEIRLLVLALRSVRPS